MWFFTSSCEWSQLCILIYSKTLLKLAIPRIKLLRNRREIQMKQMRREIAKLLETGQEASARIRVKTWFFLWLYISIDSIDHKSNSSWRFWCIEVVFCFISGRAYFKRRENDGCTGDNWIILWTYIRSPSNYWGTEVKIWFSGLYFLWRKRVSVLFLNTIFMSSCTNCLSANT